MAFPRWHNRGAGMLRLRRTIPLLFWREEFETVCCDLFILKQALKADAQSPFKSLLAGK
jgi:hypothetical protein